MPARAKPLLLLATALLMLACPASCSYPVLFPVAKDAATSLYTIPLRDGAHHVVDLAGPLLWSTCAADHLPASIDCQDRQCKLANAYRPPGCSAAARPCKKRCVAYPYNPVTRQCAPASLIHTRLIANTTDGRNPVAQASVRAVGACAPSKLLARLPAGATGVAGLAGSGLAIPAQVAASQRVANQFMLCLPRVSRGGFGSDDEGVAIFGKSPFYTTASDWMDFAASMTFTSLLRRVDSPAYYLPVKAIAVGGAQLQLPGDALATGGVVFSTRVPYTTLRSDVYRPLVDAFHKASGWEKIRVPAVPPFELCYNASRLPLTRIGRLAPDVDLMLQDGKNYTVVSLESMVESWDLGPVPVGASCFGVVERKEGNKQRGHGVVAPAVEIGGFQMENSLLQFDLDKMQLGFTKLPFWTRCAHFNHTLRGH
jgi:hypothetical protein